MGDEDRIRQAAGALSSRLQASLSAEVEAFVAELSRAVAEERAEAQATTAERVAGELLAAKADAERALQEEIARFRDEAERAAQEAASRAADEIAEVKADAERRVQEETAAARADAEGRLQEEIARVREETDQAVQKAIAAARAEKDGSFEIERARAAAERDQDTKFQVTAALARERQSQLQVVECVAGAFRRLDQAQSLTEILTALVDGAAAEVPRVAVLTVEGRRIRSWRLAGFAPDVPPVDLPLEETGVVARALEQRDIAFAEPAAPDHPNPPGPGFTALPADRSGIAVPIIVGGAPVAVLYADDVSDAEQTKPAAWPEVIEIMARHAALRLENLTAVRMAALLGAGRVSAGPRPAMTRPAETQPAAREDLDEAEARRYARLLLSEVKFYNESAVRVGRERGDLLHRLRNDIDRARRLYDERIPAAVGSKWLLFDDELVQTLAGGDPSRLGPRTGALA